MSLRHFKRIPRIRSSSVYPPQTCKLGTSRVLCLKEDADRSPGQIEQKKTEQLHKANAGKGKWHEELASAGESNVKADREQVKDHEDHMEKLQKETAKKGEKGQL